MRLLRKTHAQINLTALKYNLNSVRECMRNGSKLYFCIKANGYGHGSVEVAKAAELVGVTDFAVELAEEGAELRENGIQGEILILGRANAEQMKCAVDYRLNQCIVDADDVFLMQSQARNTDNTAMAHLKIDTGMGRIGVNNKSQMNRLISALKECHNVKLNGVFTHFACADENDKDYTHKQAETFFEYIKILNAQGFNPKIHMANSAACIDLPQYATNYGRCGIAAYGYAPSSNSLNKLPDLRPVMTILAEISQVKNVPAGFRVGYNSTFVTNRPTCIATVQIGYADGYPRQLSNKGKMIVKGDNEYFYAPVIGRVCMDQVMIDITGVEGIKKGDLAIAMGSVENLSINANNIADMCGTISYEILTGFSPRIPRVYLYE